jgi:NAD(P)-dependent dehydrogenase (short-subunit alcohol dehydrogenase family)
MKLEGRIALVTGCGPNIGVALALALAAEGARLACVDVDPFFAGKCAEQVRRAGGEALPLACNVTHEPKVQETVQRVVESFGGIDVLVNGVAKRIGKGVLDTTFDEFRDQTDVILGGTFLFTKHVAQAMIQRGGGGSIINLISTEGHQGYPGSVGYGTAKAGLLNFTRSVAMELAEHRIRVNSLTPTSTDPKEGIIRAREWGVEPRMHEPKPPDFAPGVVGVPLGRLPSPSDYGPPLVFLASDDSEMVTGLDLRVDAGVIARYWRWQPGLK